MSTIEQFAAAVPEYLSFYQDKSPCTRDLKQYVLGLFVDFASQEYPGREMVPEMALSFRRSLYGLSPNTVAQYMKQVRSAFSFMLDAGLIQGENPVRPMFVGQERYQPYDSLLTEQDIQRILLDSCPRQIRSRIYVRARAMTLLCLSSGLRLEELLALSPADLDWENGRALVRHGKGDKRRAVPFHPVAQEAVGKYLDAQRKGCPDGLPLFVQAPKKGGFKPLSTRTAQYNISQYVEAMTGRADISPHDLRHSAASWWVSCGVPIREVQTLLGHTNVQTTERYAQLVAPDTAPIHSANAVMSQTFGRLDSLSQFSHPLAH